MTKKLLHKTTKIYLLVSISVLLAVAPIFYFESKRLYIEDADEALVLREKEFRKFNLETLVQEDITVWNRFNRDIKIIENRFLKKDTIFYNVYYDELSDEHEPYRELNAPIIIDRQPYTLMVRINLVETEDLLSSIAFLFFIIIALLLSVVFWVTRKLSKEIWKPFYQTLDQIEKFEIDKSSKPEFSTTNIEEFSRLNQSLEKLIKKNSSIYKAQREFVENAAHELQTPLAIFQAKIDNLFQRTDLSKEQSEIIASLNDNVAKLRRLNKNLLLLSKIENDSFLGKEEIDLGRMIDNNLEFFVEQGQAKGIEIHTKFNYTLLVKSNPVLLEILLRNLFLNAVTHTPKGGEVFIAVDLETCSFSNTGSGEALKEDKLFQRFSKTNPSTQGNGLGLAIIKKIIELNRWSIEYHFENNFHIFQIKAGKF